MRTTPVAVIAAVGVAGSLLIAAPAMARPATAVTASPAAAPAVAPAAAHRAPVATAETRGAHMSSYPASAFQAQAAKLPGSLDAQLRAKLGITPAQFLADGQAAADATKVIAGLRARGVEVTGAKMSGTQVTISVARVADEAAVRAAGALAAVAPAAAPTVEAGYAADALTNEDPASGTTPLAGGDDWSYVSSASGDSWSGQRCSVGFNGYSASTGRPEFVTAGHCYTSAASTIDPTSYIARAGITSADALTELNALPSQANGGSTGGWDTSNVLGTMSTSNFHFGDAAHDDYGIVPVTDSKAQPQASVTTWGSADGATASQGVQNSTFVPVVGSEAPLVNEPVCHSGATTGWQCGVVSNLNERVTTSEGGVDATVDSIATSVCIVPGDSGGSFITGQYALGVASTVNTTTADGSCPANVESNFYPLVAPAGTNQPSVATEDADFRIAVAEPSTSTVLAVDGSGNPVGLSGALSFAGGTPAAPGTPVSLSIDGGATSTTASAADGTGNQTWKFALSGLSAGSHSYTITVGTGPSAVTTTGTLDAPLTAGAPTISGVAAPGRTLTASAPGASPHASLTYQWLDLGASGADSSAIPGATAQSFTPSASLSGHHLAVRVTATELGASTSATSAATAALAPYAGPTTSRLAGSDRYSTAVAVAKSSYPAGGANVVVIASGANFPDALAAAPAAVKLGGPLLLTEPTTLPPAVAAEITSLAPQKIVIVGGPSAVSASVAAALGQLAPVTRVYGADRYATSLAVAEYAFGSTSMPAALVATGNAFPDALSASAYAGSAGMPVLLVNGTADAVPAALTAWLKAAHTTSVSIAGGTGAVSSGIQTALAAATAHSVARFGGANRYATSQLIDDQFTSAATAYFATGTNFPDALTGAAAAGKAGAPLFLVEPGCVPQPVLGSLTAWKTTTVEALGGVGVLGESVTSLSSCG